MAGIVCPKRVAYERKELPGLICIKADVGSTLGGLRGLNAPLAIGYLGREP